MPTSNTQVDTHGFDQPSTDQPPRERDEWEEPDWDDLDDYPYPPTDPQGVNSLPEPPHPVNWNLLTPDEARIEWYALDQWVDWLRTTYSLPAATLPPYWHRHPELVWELSALHLHWLGAYDPDQHGSAPLGWHRDFADTRHRLREWVALSGTKLTFDRPTQRPVWPGEQPPVVTAETLITNREDDFDQFVQQDLQRRRQAEHGVGTSSLAVDADKAAG